MTIQFVAEGSEHDKRGRHLTEWDCRHMISQCPSTGALHSTLPLAPVGHKIGGFSWQSTTQGSCAISAPTVMNVIMAVTMHPQTKPTKDAWAGAGLPSSLIREAICYSIVPRLIVPLMFLIMSIVRATNEIMK